MIYGIIFFVFFLIVFFIKNITIEYIKLKNDEKVVFSSFIVWIFVFLLMGILCLHLFFSSLTIDQIIFTMNMPVKGTSSSILLTFIGLLIIFPLVLFICNYLFLKKRLKFVFKLKSFSFTVFPYSFKYCTSIVVCILTIFFIYANINLDLINFLKFNFKKNEQFYEKNYIDPRKVSFKFPQKKKNLILIYLESVEAETYKYARKNTNLIPELTAIANKNISFSHNSGLGGAKQVYGTGHSVASICCSHLGLPLVLPVGVRSYENTIHFFNGAYGLGDLLNANGYKLSFVMGANAEFGGLDTLLKTHGDFEIKELNYFRKINKVPPDYFVWWGIEDKKIIEFSKEELLNLSGQDSPFLFSVFLEDTHSLGGYVSDDCEKKYPTQIHNVFACMSKRVDGFLKWIEQQEFYNDSVVVILGDHLYMGYDLYKTKGIERHAYNAFINVQKPKEKTKNRQYSTFDYFPTIVESLDIEFDADGLGLGRSLFSGKQTLLEQLGEKKLNELIMSKSNFYRYKLLNKKE